MLVGVCILVDGFVIVCVCVKCVWVCMYSLHVFRDIWKDGEAQDSEEILYRPQNDETRPHAHNANEGRECTYGVLLGPSGIDAWRWVEVKGKHKNVLYWVQRTTLWKGSNAICSMRSKKIHKTVLQSLLKDNLKTLSAKDIFKEFTHWSHITVARVLGRN